MINKLEAVICYFIEEYPHKKDLEEKRLAKMVYLADWLSCLRHGKQITKTMWIYNYFGPHVDDILLESIRSERLSAQPIGPEGGEMLFNFSGDFNEVLDALNDEDISALDTVIAETRSLYDSDFVNLVYSTPPVIRGTKTEALDLVASAKEVVASREGVENAGRTG